MPDTSFNLGNLTIPGLNIPIPKIDSGTPLTEAQLNTLSPTQRAAYLQLAPEQRGYIHGVDGRGGLDFGYGGWENSGLQGAMNQQFGLIDQSAPLERFQEAYQSPFFQVMSPEQQAQQYGGIDTSRGGTYVNHEGPSIWTGLGRAALTGLAVYGAGAGLSGALGSAEAGAGTGLSETAATGLSTTVPEAGAVGTGAGAASTIPEIVVYAPTTTGGLGALGETAAAIAPVAGAGLSGGSSGVGGDYTSSPMGEVTINAPGYLPPDIDPSTILAGFGGAGALSNTIGAGTNPGLAEGAEGKDPSMWQRAGAYLSDPKNLSTVAKGIGAVGGLLGAGGPGADPGGPPATPGLTSNIDPSQFAMHRAYNPLAEGTDYNTYGEGPEHSFFKDEQTAPQPVMADGGYMSQHVRGPGSGRSDDIPARLSDGEFIVDAETVSLLGDGSNDAGARKLEQMRQQIRKHKGRKLARGDISPNAHNNAVQYMSGVT